MYQSLTRAIPAVQDAELFSWLRGLYPLWAGLTPEMVAAAGPAGGMRPGWATACLATVLVATLAGAFLADRVWLANRGVWEAIVGAGPVVPVPAADELPTERVEAVIQQATAEAAAQGISGKRVTPFLLGRVAELTGGESRRASGWTVVSASAA